MKLNNITAHVGVCPQCNIIFMLQINYYGKQLREIKHNFMLYQLKGKQNIKYINYLLYNRFKENLLKQNIWALYLNRNARNTIFFCSKEI